jgi:hypothetical protein
MLSIEKSNDVGAFPLHPVLCARTVMGDERPLAPFAGLVTVMPAPLGGGVEGVEPDPLLVPPDTVNVVLTVGHSPLLTHDL